MIKNQFFTLFFILFLLSIGCKNEQKETAAIIHKEIMDEHDKIMPKSSEIMRLKGKLIAYNEIVSEDNFTLKDSLLNSILVLSKSADMMNDWMANYKYPNPELSPDALVKYLTMQKDTIGEIGNTTFMSLAIGQGLLSNAPDSIKNTKPKTAASTNN
jgi:tRNA threonylcarbamoyladenosine modification (KEOPS) complex  Pcc1 subunit